MGRIGGVIEDMLQTANTMTTTGGAVSDMSTGASGRTRELSDAVDGVSNTLVSQFGELANGLRQQIASARDRLGATDWDGSSRLAAEAAEADLNRQTSQLLDAALEGVQQLKTNLITQVSSFQGEVEGQFTSMMTEVDNRYRELGEGTSTVARNFEEADSMRYGG
jgi:uncharacterized phage infection (PIP) family protein YhgE